MKNLVLFLLSFYQRAVSPYLGFRCRYIPTCSDYMRDAIREDGLGKGVTMGARRLFRCAPWFGSGYDPYNKESSR